jgi:hypothetical protein
MYDDEYEFDYDRVVEDAEELYEYADYSDEPEYEDDYTNEREYEHYYHNVMDELDNE